jgi:type IV pilus assembly protein PilB
MPQPTHAFVGDKRSRHPLAMANLFTDMGRTHMRLMGDNKAKLGALLLDAGLVSERELKAALCFQKNQRCLLGASLVRLGFLSEEKLLDFLEHNLDLQRIVLDGFQPAQDVLCLVPKERALAFTVFPVELIHSHSGPVLRMAMADPCNLTVIEALEFMTGHNIQPVLASESAIHRAIQKNYGNKDGDAPCCLIGEKLENDQKTEVCAEKLDRLVELLRSKGILSFEEIQWLEKI